MIPSPWPRRYSPTMATTPMQAHSETKSARAAAATHPEHPAVWQPWQQLAADAATRYRTELAAALAALLTASNKAGQVLDLASATAAANSSPLRDAAYTTFERYMTAADAAEAAVMTPAVQAYDATITAAHSAYGSAITNAGNTYRQLLASAQAAKTAAASIPAAV